MGIELKVLKKLIILNILDKYLFNLLEKLKSQVLNNKCKIIHNTILFLMKE
mgnify:FL=1